MRKAVGLGAAALIASLGASSVAAMSSGQHQQWFSKAVEKRLAYPFSHARSETGGIALIGFDTAEGRSSNARILKSSRHLGLDRAALLAIASLPELPVAFPCGSHIAVIQFGVAGTPGELTKLERKRAAAIGEAQRMAQSSEPARVAECPDNAAGHLVLFGGTASG
jgi:hypothetical protein